MVGVKFGLRAIATLYEFGLCEFGRVASASFKFGPRTVCAKFGLHKSGRVASTSFSGAASYAYDCGLRVASNKFGQVASLESGPVAFLFDDCGL